MTKDRTGLKQLHLSYDLPAEWHTIIKIRCVEQNKHMRDWIFEAIQEKLKREEELGWK